ncbi:MAG: NADH-quinone oxidoreductase subunit NuoE [Gammaproteobacteria bacterium]
MNQDTKNILSEHAKAEIDLWLKKYPPEHKQSTVLAALREVQHENGGYLTEQLMDAVAGYLDMPPIAVYEVASFYSMLETKPVGRHSISVCTNISCMLCGADDIVTYIENKLGIRTGESTSDGRFYLKQEEECLAACCGGPMMMVDHKYYERLTKEKIDEILDGLE